MTEAIDAIIFEERKGELVAKLGVMEVGVIAKLFQDHRAFGAHWRCFLPGAGVSPRPARDMDEAKAQLQNVILGWIDAAQLSPAAVGIVEIRSFRPAAAP